MEPEELRNWYKNFKQTLWNISHIDLSVKADLLRICAYDENTMDTDFLYIPAKTLAKNPAKDYMSVNRNTIWAYDNLEIDESPEKIQQLYNLSVNGYLCIADVNASNIRLVYTDWDGTIVATKRMDKQGANWNKLQKPVPPEDSSNKELTAKYQKEKKIYEARLKIDAGNSKALQARNGNILSLKSLADCLEIKDYAKYEHLKHSLQETYKILDDADPVFLLTGSSEYKNMKKKLTETIQLMDHLKEEKVTDENTYKDYHPQLQTMLQVLASTANTYIRKKKDNPTGKYSQQRLMAAHKLLDCVENINIEMDINDDWYKRAQKPDSYTIISDNLSHFADIFDPQKNLGKHSSIKEAAITLCDYIIPTDGDTDTAIEHQKYIENILKRPYAQSNNFKQNMKKFRDAYYTPIGTDVEKITYRPFNQVIQGVAEIQKRFQKFKKLDENMMIWGEISDNLKPVLSYYSERIDIRYRNNGGSKFREAVNREVTAMSELGQIATSRIKLIHEMENDNANKQLTKEQAISIVTSSYVDYQLRTRGGTDVLELTLKLNQADTTWRKMFENSPVVDKLCNLNNRKQIMEYLTQPAKRMEIVQDVAGDFLETKLKSAKAEKKQNEKQNNRQKQTSPTL